MSHSTICMLSSGPRIRRRYFARLLFATSAVAAAIVLQPSLAAAQQYTWSDLTTSATDAFGAPSADWINGIPVSGSTTELTFIGTTAGAGSLSAGLTSTITDNDAGAFQLNILDLGGISASTGAADTITIAASAGDSLDFVSNGPTLPTINLAANAGTGTAPGLTYNVSAPITLGNNTTFSGNGTAVFNFSGIISGANTLTKSGTSTLTLSNAGNTYSGATTINGGTLSISADGDLGTAPGVVTPAAITLNGGTLQVTATTAFEVPTIKAVRGITLGASGGTIKVTALSTGTFAGSETAVQYDGVITGGGNLSITGGTGTNSGTAPYILELLGGASNYTGTTSVTNAIVAFQAGANGGVGPNNVLPTTTVLSLTSNGWLDMNNGASNQTLAGLSGDSTGEIGSTNGTSGDTLTINPALGQNYTYAGLIGPMGILGKGPSAASPINLVIGGAGTETLSGTNTYEGSTTINSGALNIQNNSALGTATNHTSGVTVASGSALQIQGGITTSFAVPLNIKGAGLTASPAGAIDNISGTNTYTGLVTLGAAATIQSDAGSLALTNVGTITGATFGLTLAGAGNGSIASIIGTTSGTLTKVGAGTWSLSGVNTYTGLTAVNAGALQLSGTGSINTSSGITINGSSAKFVQTSSTALTPAITLTQGRLDGTGTVGTVTVGAGTGGIVQNGNGGATALTINSLTFSGAGAANLTVAGGATTAPALIVTNALTNSVGPVALSVTPVSGWNNSTTYNLIQFGSFTGSLANFSTVGNINDLTPRQTATLGTAGNDITLTITGDTPKWTGLDSTNWQVGTTGPNSNWKLISALSATDYIQGDSVLFDDSATGAVSPGVVTINGGNVSPTSTIFSNSSINYTVSSTGGFGIASGFVTKNGSGTVTLSTANTYTGATTINSGTLRVNGSLAAGSAINVGGASAGGASGTPTLAGSGTINGPVTIVGTGAGIIVGHLAPSGFTGSSGTTLNLAGALTLNTGSDLDFNLSNSTSAGNDLVSITGSGAVNYGTGGVLNINAISANALTVGTYTLISDSSSTTPTGGTGWTVGANHDSFSSIRNYAISVVGKNLDLTVTEPLTWSGQNGSAWDTSTANWANLAFSGATFFNGVSAFFGDTQFASGPPVVNNHITMSVVGGVSPASVVFNNTNTPVTGVPYTITSNDVGAVGITGTTGITLAGTGSVTLLGPNTYTGTTQLNAGTLVIGNNNSIGSVSGTIAPLTFNGGTLEYAASSTNTDISGRTVTIGAGGATIDLNGNNVSYASAIGNNGTGSLKLLNSGAGPAGAAATLTLLSGASTYSGGTSISGGTLNVSFTGSPTEAAGASSYLGIVPSAVAAANISLNGGTLEFTNATGTPTITLSNNRGITLGSLGGTLESVMAPTTAFGNSGVVYGGVVTGNGSLTILGNGTGLTTQGVVFFPNFAAATTGLWTYTGNTTINGATLSFPSGGSAVVNVLPATTVLNLINNGALNLANTGSAQTIAGLTGTGTVGNTNTGSTNALTISPPALGNSTFNGVIAGAFSFEGKNGTSSLSVTLSGSGTQIFAGANGYYGGTTLKSGTLGIDSATAIGVPTTVGTTVFPDTFVINGGTIDNLTSPSTPITLSTNNTQTWGPATVGPTGSFTYGGTGSLNLGTGAVTIAGDTSTPFTETIIANVVNPGSALTIGGPISPATTVTTADTLAIGAPAPFDSAARSPTAPARALHWP